MLLSPWRYITDFGVYDQKNAWEKCEKVEGWKTNWFETAYGKGDYRLLRIGTLTEYPKPGGITNYYFLIEGQNTQININLTTGRVIYGKNVDQSAKLFWDAVAAYGKKVTK